MDLTALVSQAERDCLPLFAGLEETEMKTDGDTACIDKG